MPISSGTVSKGEKGKPKFQTLNLNNVFSQSKGESSKPNQQKALFNKHGMSVLGKVPSARKPLNLPSLKSESSGNDPPVNLVPTGGSGWGNKPGETGPPPATVVTTPPITTINTSVPPPPIVEKSWSAKIAGKPSNPPNYNSTHQSPLFNQEFPSLSGNVDVQYGPGPSLRPQTEGSWILGGSHPTTGGEVGNLQGTAPVQDHPTETLRPEVAAILPSFMMKQETQFTGFNNPPPRVAHRFSSHPPNHDNRFMQHPPPHRNKDLVHCAIVKEEELSKLDEVSKEGGWSLHDSVDYNQQLHFSDDEAEESENKENKNSARHAEKSSAISDKTNSHIEDEMNLLKKKEFNEILEKAKVRKESEEQRFIESKMNATKKYEALSKNIEERKKENDLSKDERKTTGQPVVKDGNEFRQLTQLSSDKPQSYKEPANNFSSSRFLTSNKPPRLRKQQEEMQHKGFYRPNQERNYYEGDYDRDNRPRGEYNSRFNMNNSRDREYNRSGYDNRKFSDQKSSYNRDPDMKYQGRYSDSSDPSIESRQRDSWERETPKRKDSDRSKQSYEDENDRYRSDNELREKSIKEMNSWENDKQDEYEERWADHTEYDRDDGFWEKERKLERPTGPDSRDNRASRESKTSHSDHNLRDEKLNVIDDPEENIERDRKPLGLYKNTRGAGVPITIEKLEAAESKQDKSSVLVPLVRSDKSGDYKKDGKDEEKKQLDAWSTPLNTSKFNSEQKKEESPPGESVKHFEPNQEKQRSEEPADKENKDRNVDRKEGKEVNSKKERGERDAHHRDRERERSGRGNNRYQQSSRSSEWSNNNYHGSGGGSGRNWTREGKDPRYDSRDNRRGHGRAPTSRNTYSRHPRSESDPESGKEDRYHEGNTGNTRERRVEKGRKERDESWYNNERERYDRKEREHYYEGRSSREYSQRGGGGSGYRSSNQSSGQGRRVDNFGGSSKNNFSGDEKKPREKKEPTSEDDKKEKKNPAKPAHKSGREKEWEGDASRGSRGSRTTYTARKSDKFSKERPVKEENKEDIENIGESEQKPKEAGDNKPEHGFQEVKPKKTASGKENTATPSPNTKKSEEKGKQKETSKAAVTGKQGSAASQGSKSVSNSGKNNNQQSSGKSGADKSKNEASATQQKKQENTTIDESKIQSFSMAKDVMTGPPPPPPATNAWDRPLNSAVLKSASPTPVKTQTPPPRPASSASSNAQTEPVSHASEEVSQHLLHQQQQQQQQHLQNQQHQQYQQQQQSLAEQHQQQLQAQQLIAAQKQQQQQQQQQQQVQQQTLDKIDSSLLDGNTSVPTMLFENRNYKGVEYRNKEPMPMEEYKQPDLGMSKDDNSAADMKLDFTYGSDLSGSTSAEDHHLHKSSTSSGGHNHLLPHNSHLQHMVQSSAVELNWKIASVKSFWEEPEAKQQQATDVNAFPVQHSGSSGGHFGVVPPDGSPSGGPPSNPSASSGSYKTLPVSSPSVVAVDNEAAAAAVAAELQQCIYGGPRGTMYASALSVKEQQELAKLNKQQMQVAAQGTPTGSVPPPPQQQAQSYAPAPTHYAPNPAHQFTQAATAAMLYSTPLQNQGMATSFGNYSLNEQTAQLLSTAQGPRQTTTQYPFLSLGQTFNQSSIYIPTTPSPASDLASQMTAGGYRLTAAAPPGPGYPSTGPGLSSSGAPPNPTTLYIQSAQVKSGGAGVPPIGTKTNYQPSPPSQQVYIPANMFDPTGLMSQNYLSQPAQQRPAPSASSFYSGNAGTTGQAPTAYYQNTYATNNPYSLGYGAQSPGPTGQQQMSTAGMGKPVVGTKYSQPPPQASQQQQVKYSSYQQGVVSQAQQMIQPSSQQQAGQQQQVLITQAHQQQQQSNQQ